MKLRIGHRVWLVISLLLFLFFSTSAVSYMLTKRIEDSVNQLAYVDDVSLQAVTTMDARLEEIVRATTVYALNAGDVDREHLKALVFEFSNAATTYMRLSTVADQRRLANDALKSFTRHSPYTIQIRGNRTTFPPPRKLYPLCSHPMA